MKINYEELCPGIRRTVQWFNQQGFETTDSGDGVSNQGMECASEWPNVVVACHPDKLITTTEDVYKALVDHGVRFPKDSQDPTFLAANSPLINSGYDPVTKKAYVLVLNIDDKLMFGEHNDA